jgi:hypothetical protein
MIGIKFTIAIYELIQQESTECFLNCPDFSWFDEVFFHFPNLSRANIIILNQYMYGIKCKKLLLIFYVH